MKIDLVMWTRNSERTLAICLRSIDNAVPPEVVNRRIMVDGYSEDRTRDIGEKFGWEVHNAEKLGIPYQANQALRLVTTEIFASFEHDIVLNPQWFQRILPYMSNPKVAVAQGMRLSNNPIMRSIERYTSTRSGLKYTSVDNNLYRTEIIRKIGGFSTSHPISAPKELRERIWRKGYKWITDRTVVSNHLRGNVWSSIDHAYRFALLSKSYEKNWSVLGQSAKLLLSPVRSLDIMRETKCPQVILVYPLLRSRILKACIRKHGPWLPRAHRAREQHS